MYQSKLLKKFDFVEHCFFGRNLGKKKGVSVGEFSSLNASFFTEDSQENILQNRKIIESYLQCKNPISTLKQVHSTDVFNISNILSLDNMQNIQGDGLLCVMQNLPIGVYSADCIPLLFVEENHKIVGAIHCGWRGLLSGIIENTIAQINSHTYFDSQIYVAIGPSIGKQSYEVGNDFYSEHLKIDDNSKKFFINKEENKFLFDIKGYAKYRLLNCGLPLQNIDDLNLDTFENEDEFFSHRRSFLKSEKNRGLQISCIFLK
jgi:YfiH family protein